MTSYERALLNYLFLAKAAEQKNQIPGRDRFLVLAIYQACQAAYPTEAEAIRQQILKSSPRHLLHNYNSAAEAVRSDSFASLHKQLQRFCSPERAEQLATDLGFEAEEHIGQDLAHTLSSWI